MRFEVATPLISRKAALAQGLKRYFTGLSCKRGHITERQVSSLTCMECDRQHARDAHEKLDPEIKRQRSRKWREANRAKDNEQKRIQNQTPARKASRAAWYQANKDRLRPVRLARYTAQRSDRIAYAKAWVEANPERAAESFRIAARVRRTRKHAGGGKHNASELREILQSQGHRCAYCRADLKKEPKHVDHIVPLARGGSNGRTNLQYLCAPCNQSKSARDPIAFAQSIGLLL